MRRNGKGTYRDNGDKTYSVRKRAKQGNQWFPGKPRKLHYKRRGWVVKKGGGKKRKKHKKGEILQEKTIRKIESEEKILRESQILLPSIL